MFPASHEPIPPLESQRPGLRRRAGVSLVATALAVPVVYWLQRAAGPDIAFSAIYLLPVSLAAWFVSLRWGLVIATLSTVAWFAADLAAEHSRDGPAILYVNAGLGLLAFSWVAYLLGRIRGIHARLNEDTDAGAVRLASEVLARSHAEWEISHGRREHQQRIANELHDDIGQHLAAIALKARVLRVCILQEEPGTAGRSDELVTLLENAARRVREMAHGLDTLRLEDGGLPPSLRKLALEVDLPGCVRVEFETNNEHLRLPAQTALHLYRIAQEAVHNAVAHGRASEIRVSLNEDLTGTCLTIRDNGDGFSPEQSRKGLGLRLMKLRSKQIGGDFRIDSAPSRGAVVACRISRADSTFMFLTKEEAV